MKYRLTYTRLRYRPDTYWPTSEAELLEILSGITNSLNRRIVRCCWKYNELDKVGPDRLPDSVRSALGRLRPKSRTGEYLPTFSSESVVIARIILNEDAYNDVQRRTKSTPEAELRARPTPHVHLRATPTPDGRIQIAWTCEVEGKWGDFSTPHNTFDAPLSFGELIKFIEGSSCGSGKLPLCFNDYYRNQDPVPDPNVYRGINWMSSDFYRELNPWMWAKSDVWADERLIEWENEGFRRAS